MMYGWQTAPVCQATALSFIRVQDLSSNPYIDTPFKTVTSVVSSDRNAIVNIMFTCFVESLGPCIPQAVVANVECNSSIGSVSWIASNRNETYIAVATGLDAHTHQCVTTNSSCTWNDLHCGEEYTVQVMARNGICTSLPSNSSVIHTGTRPFLQSLH